MLIDKATGKGCAWSIVSKTITKKLIADGIINKAIFRKQRSSYDAFLVVGYNRNQAYVTMQTGSKWAEEPLWVPSFIDA